MRISWRDHITNEEVMRRAGVAPMGGQREGRPKKTWRQTAKEDQREIGVSWHGARRVARDRSKRGASRATIHFQYHLLSRSGDIWKVNLV